MPLEVILVSPRDLDVPLLLDFCGKRGGDFHHLRSGGEKLRYWLRAHPQAAVFWDVDHPGASERSDPFFVGNIGKILAQKNEAQRTFVISEQVTGKLRHVTNAEHRLFMHNLLRKNNSVAFEAYGSLIESALTDRPQGLEQFFEKENKKQEIRLKDSSHRAAAIVAMKSFLEKNGLTPRLSNQVAQATDELLLNAIFDAPVDEEGESYRKKLDRNAQFSLTKKEEVVLSVMSNHRFFGVSIKDQFGSLDLGKLIPSLYRNYGSDGYQPNEGAGLGLNKVVESGFSLFLVSLAGESTEAMLFFPCSKNHAEFKSKFRFLSAVSRAGSESNRSG